MDLVLDAGALVAVDRGERRIAQLVELTRRTGGSVSTVAPVVTQVWRHGGRQARLARFLPLVDVHAVDESAARRGGELLAAADASDAVDSLLAATARPGDAIVTSDPTDMTSLARALPYDVSVVRI